MKYDSLARDIIRHVGGKENVIDVVHCVTRLRFRLKDEGKADTERLKAMDGVVTVIQSGGQYQVVIGNQVAEVYDAVLEAGGFGNAVSQEEKPEQKGGLMSRLIDIVSGLFTPVLGVLAATGMIKGLTGMLAALGILSTASGTYQLLYIIGDSMFYFLPMYLGFTAAKKFKLNEFVGMTIGACLVYPSLTAIMAGEPLFKVMEGTILQSPVHLKFLGLPVLLMRYSSSVIPVIIAVYFAARLQNRIKKILPDVVKGFLTPCITLLIIVPATFLVIGPAATWMSQIVGAVTMAIYGLSPMAAGFLLGGTWQLLVMFGLHWGMAPVGLNNLVTYGYDAVTVLKSATPIVTACVVLAVALRTKDKKMKGICRPACISSLFGVSEPSIYGVTLPLKRPFIITLLCSALGGVIMGAFQTKAFMAGGMGIFSIPSYINPETGIDGSLYGYLLAIVISGGLGFILTWFFGLSPEKKEDSASSSASDIVINSPLRGRVIPLDQVEDEAFSCGVMGMGAAVIPSEGRVHAPVDGVVTALFPTLHAIGITSDEGVEILIHIGMDTVKLNGDGFKAHAAQGDRVRKGQLLVEFDMEKIKQAGYSLTTPVIISNTPVYQAVTVLAQTGDGAGTENGAKISCEDSLLCISTC